MRFSTLLVAALSSAGFALAAVSKNGIIRNGAFDCESDERRSIRICPLTRFTIADAFGWEVSTDRDGVVVGEPDISRPHGSPPLVLG